MLKFKHSFSFLLSVLLVLSLINIVFANEYFGYNSAIYSTERSAENYIRGTVAECEFGGVGQSIIVLIGTLVSPALHMKCALYKYDGSNWDVIANGVTEEILITEAEHEYSWVTFNFEGVKPTLEAEQEYGIACWGESGSGSMYVREQEFGLTGFMYFYKSSQVYNSFPDNVVWTGTDNDGALCIYCIYSLGGELNWFGEVSFSFSTGTLKNVLFTRIGISTLTFLSSGSLSFMKLLNFFGSVDLSFIVKSIRVFSSWKIFTVFGEAILTFNAKLIRLFVFGIGVGIEFNYALIGIGLLIGLLFGLILWEKEKNRK